MPPKRKINLRNSLLMVSLASLDRPDNLFGICLSLPFTLPLAELQVGIGQLLFPFFLWAFIKQGLQTRESEPTSESDKPKSEAKVLVVIGLEVSTKDLHTLHWCGALFTVSNKEREHKLLWHY